MKSLGPLALVVAAAVHGGSADAAGPAPVSAARATAPAPTAAADGYVRHLAALINEYRQRHGLAPLEPADELAALAGEHSHAMAAQRRLSHEGFRDRLLRAGSRVCVENVGQGYRTAEALLEGWRQSPAHHVNLLADDVARMGIAASARYVTFFACR
ncbi:MAG: CAP domain-containing protein [Rubrivivax sp.]|nr:CAP domain-containing protein [Rubrivivax sp.]